MENVLECLPQGGRVAVIRLRSLGDCVLTTPALQVLKGARPDIKIAIVIEDGFAPVFEGNPDVYAVLAPKVSAIRNWQPLLSLNLHGGSRSGCLTLSSGAPFRAGFAHFRYSFLYNVRIPRAQEILGIERKVHTAEHLASAIFYLGVPRVEIPAARLFVPLPSGPAISPSPYAVIHPVASDKTKTWAAEKFVGIGRYLRNALGLEPIFIAGAGEDLASFRDYRTVIGAPLSVVKSVLRGATLFVGNDSGPAHMAAAFGIPVVVIFGSSDPVVWSPWKTASEVLTGPAGINSVEEDQVVQALDRLQVHA